MVLQRLKRAVATLSTLLLCVSAALGADRGTGSEQARWARWDALSKARAEDLANHFKPMRMVIGGPCFFYGIDPVITDDLKAAGMEVLVWPDAPLVDPGTTSRMTADPMLYNVIIFGESFYHLVQPDPATGELPPRITEQAAQLKRFLEAGGGVWFCGLGEHTYGRSYHALNYILKEIGADAEVINEVVVLGKEAKQKQEQEQKPVGGYAWVQVSDDHLTQGVENLLHPHSFLMDFGAMAVVPIVKLSSQWRVLVRGGKDGASYPLDRNDEHGATILTTPGAVKSSPILVAVREVGKGRVVLWPTWSNHTVTGGSGGALVDAERDGTTSNGARLIENLLCWLAEPSQGSAEVGTFDPRTATVHKYTPPDIEKAMVKQTVARKGANHYKGLVGAHSTLSDGQNSPEEMIAAAKNAGYDFIGFSEDFAKMDEAKWNQLVAICDKVNVSDPKFRAYSGLEFLDEAGNRCVAFGQRWWIKDERRSKQYSDRIRWWYQLSYGAEGDVGRWMPRVIIHSKSNNKRPWNQGLYSFFAAYCYEGGKLVDDSLDEWRPLVGPHVYHMSVAICAVHTVRNVQEVSASSRPGLYQTFVRANSLDDILRYNINGIVDFYTYISAGPQIESFETIYYGDWEGAYLDAPGNRVLKLDVHVQADAGLRELRIYDRQRLVRRIKPAGTEFKQVLTFPLAELSCYTMTAIDDRGNMAESWTAYAQVREWPHRRCGDNLNWMRAGGKRGSLRPPQFEYHLLETVAGWRPRQTEKESTGNGAAQAITYTNAWTSYEHQGYEQAWWGVINPAAKSGLLIDGQPWKDTVFPSVTLNFHSISLAGPIVSNDVTDDLVSLNPEPYRYAAFSGPYPVTPVPWPAKILAYYLMPKIDGTTNVVRCRTEVEFTRTVSGADGGPVAVSFGNRGPIATPAMLEVRHADGQSEMYPMEGEKSISGEIPAGGYIAWYGPGGNGIGGIIALEPGLKYDFGGGKWMSIGTPVPSPVKPGTTVSYDAIAVSGINPEPNSNQLIMDIWKGMGIGGEPTLYRLEPQLGRVADQKLFLIVEAEDGGFSGRVLKTTDRLLPVHLPVQVKGLNPRWHATIWYRGESHLPVSHFWVEPWSGVASIYAGTVASYERMVDEWKSIPVLEGGIGYCQVDTDKQDPNVFIGHPLVCDQPEVFLAVVEAGRGKCTFEINNPTDRELTCSVRPSKGFELTGRWRKKITLPVGGHEVVTVGSKG